MTLASVLKGRRPTLVLVVMLSLLSALLSVLALAFISQRLLTATSDLGALLLQFGLLLAALLITGTAAQALLHRVGHHEVYQLRRNLVRRVLATDIEQLERVGGAPLLAALSTDVRNLTIAFVHLPELVYGATLTVAALIWLAWLSPPLFLVTLAWLGVLALLGVWLVGRINHYVARVRRGDDDLYSDYQAMIDGRKELALNRFRGHRFFDEEFDGHARAYRDHVTRADLFNGLAGNLSNVLMLGLIGVLFYLAAGLGWAQTATASVFALTILLLRAPLIGAVAALPALLAARVSLKRLAALSLAEAPPSEPRDTAWPEFSRLDLRGVTYRYPDQDGCPGFAVGPLDLSIRKGELIFVQGGNGSGKSTLARLLTGLYRPHDGAIAVNGEPVDEAHRQAYRRLFSSVFTDFHLFHRIVDGDGDEVGEEEVRRWLDTLGMTSKVTVRDGRLEDVRFSQGQRKRLALLMAVVEQRACLLLDEWAADQDPGFRRFFYRELLPALKARGMTIIAITHDDHYFDQADRLLKMDGGRLLELNADAARDSVLQLQEAGA